MDLSIPKILLGLSQPPIQREPCPESRTQGPLPPAYVSRWGHHSSTETLGKQWVDILGRGFDPTPGYHLYYAARNNGYTAGRAASFVGKALALAKEPRQGLGPPPGPLPRGAGRRPSSGSPPDCAVSEEVSPTLRTAQYIHQIHGFLTARVLPRRDESCLLFCGRLIPRKHRCPSFPNVGMPKNPALGTYTSGTRSGG